jgi:hypothetical protein
MLLGTKTRIHYAYTILQDKLKNFYIIVNISSDIIQFWIIVTANPSFVNNKFVAIILINFKTLITYILPVEVELLQSIYQEHDHSSMVQVSSNH